MKCAKKSAIIDEIPVKPLVAPTEAVLTARGEHSLVTGLVVIV
ncbi:MAG: hypothetical protein ACFFD4_00825 [Candidatus Odinarchaeota archaeon]